MANFYGYSGDSATGFDQMFFLRILSLLLATIACAPVAQTQESHQTITICELLRDSSKYNGKVVAVPGEYFAGGHGLYLRGSDCDGILTTRGYRWPALIWISPMEKEFTSRGLNFYHASRAEIEIATVRERERQRIGVDWNSEKVTLTYVGLYETREHFDREVGRGRDGKLVANGFGPGNTAPGQLFVDSVKDIAVDIAERVTPK